jgi:hypothetical protein
LFFSVAGRKLFCEILAIRPFGKLNRLTVLFVISDGIDLFFRQSIGEMHLPIHSANHFTDSERW